MTPSSPSSRGPDDEQGQSTPSLTSELGRYGGHGLTLALSTALFGWLGVLADDRLGTEPLFVLLGVFVGFGAGFYSMYSKLVAGQGASGQADRTDGEGVGGEPPDASGPGAP